MTAYVSKTENDGRDSRGRTPPIARSANGIPDLSLRRLCCLSFGLCASSGGLRSSLGNCSCGPSNFVLLGVVMSAFRFRGRLNLL